MWAVSDGMCQGAEVVKAVLLPAMQNSSSVSQHSLRWGLFNTPNSTSVCRRSVLRPRGPLPP